MSTHDVPGANPNNGDILKVGCWAECEDSLLFVKSAEGDRVIFEVYDLSHEPIVYMQDAMRIADFKEQFTWDRSKKGGKGLKAIPWVWHDKTAFPWDKVIKRGLQAGAQVADVEEDLKRADKVKAARKRLKTRRRKETEDESALEPHDVKDAEVMEADAPEIDESTPAGKVAKARRLQPKVFDPKMHEHRVEKAVGKQGVSIWRRIQGALDAFKNPPKGE